MLKPKKSTKEDVVRFCAIKMIKDSVPVLVFSSSNYTKGDGFIEFDGVPFYAVPDIQLDCEILIIEEQIESSGRVLGSSSFNAVVRSFLLNPVTGSLLLEISESGGK